MTKRSSVMVTVLAGALMTAGAVRADDERLRTAALVLKEMSSGSDSSVPDSLFAKAKCAVVVPGVKKAAFGFGAQYGRGYMSCRTESGGWSAPGGIRVEGGSVGFQIGGSETDVVLLVLNERGVNRLLSSQFTVGADASVAAGPVGRQAAAQTDASLTAEILAWSRARGVFAGVSLQGSTLREDSSENRELYGRDISNREIVSGTITVPPAAADLMAELGRH